MKRLLQVICLTAIFPAYGSVNLSFGEDMDRGWGDAGAVVTPYVAFTAENLKPYCGNRIVSVRIGLAQEASNCYLYIKGKPEDPNPIYKQKLGDLPAGWNEIVLETPFEIQENNNVAIGYKASFKESKGVGISNEQFTDAAAVYYNSRNQWVSADGSICIEAVVDGDRMPVNDLALSTLSVQNGNEAEESTHTYSAYVKNRGNNVVDSYKVEIALDGNPVSVIEGNKVDLNARDRFTFEVTENSAGRHNVTATVILVNGEEDTNPSDNSASATFVVKSSDFIRRVVCEEYTGTWCGLCPRGIVGLELMKEAYPDTFIAVCVHGNDPMEITGDPEQDYSKFIESCTGAPECNVNRRLKGDPFSDIKGFYNLETAGECHIKVDATSNWDESGSALEVSATFMSDIDIKAQKLNIAYTVTESGITGYPQTNYYSDGRNGEFYGWGEKDPVTLDVVYNDVARAIVGGYDGIPCHSGAMEAMTPYSHNYRVEIPESVTDNKNLAIVVQLIEPTSGYIVNACRLTPEPFSDTSIREVEEEGYGEFSGWPEEPRVMNVYDICGRLVMTGDWSEGRPLDLPEGLYVVNVTAGNTILKSMKIKVSDKGFK